MKYLFIIIAILILLLSGSVFYIKHQFNKIEDRDAQIGYLQSDFKTKADSVGRSFKDKANLWHNESATLTVTNLSLKQLLKDRDQEIVRIRNLFPSIKKNFRNLDSYTSIKTVNNSTASGVLKKDSTLASKDSITDPGKLIYIGYATNEWDTYALKVYGGGSCRLDTFQITRTGKESFDQVMYWTRKWFLGRKKYTTETVSLNPSTSIIHQNSLVVKKR